MSRNVGNGMLPPRLISLLARKRGVPILDGWLLPSTNGRPRAACTAGFARYCAFSGAGAALAGKGPSRRKPVESGNYCLW